MGGLVMNPFVGFTLQAPCCQESQRPALASPALPSIRICSSRQDAAIMAWRFANRNEVLALPFGVPCDRTPFIDAELLIVFGGRIGCSWDLWRR